MKTTTKIKVEYTGEVYQCVKIDTTKQVLSEYENVCQANGTKSRLTFTEERHLSDASFNSVKDAESYIDENINKNYDGCIMKRVRTKKKYSVVVRANKDEQCVTFQNKLSVQAFIKQKTDIVTYGYIEVIINFEVFNIYYKRFGTDKSGRGSVDYWCLFVNDEPVGFYLFKQDALSAIGKYY